MLNTFGLENLRSHMYREELLFLNIVVINASSLQLTVAQKGLYASGVSRAKAASSIFMLTLP